MSLLIEIPGGVTLSLEHLVLDYNGTLGLDGHLLEGIADRIAALAAHLQIHVLTADTFERARAELADTRCGVIVLERGNEPRQKADYVDRLGPAVCAAIGNGRNDVEMLAKAALAIAVLGDEGLASDALAAADIVAPNPVSALDLLLRPKRIAATLRS